ncbi:MAG: indole-3-glycerol phosphate synthase TrpC [Planctomycetes bacterium]|nr:indole-3-glycerol phosphate synthase TrpC [Planctomycetota bacterium]
MTILDRIVNVKRQEIRLARDRAPLEGLESIAFDAPPARSLAGALSADRPQPRIIAEVKRASPSKGVIRADVDAAGIALAYQEGGAAAISVLTDREFFQGRLEDLEAIASRVSVPVLRKDFTIDAYQVWEARAAGADAVLLIAAILKDGELEDLGELAGDLGMDVLYEVHDREELRRVARLGPRLVGINNRNLKTFEVDLETTRRLLPKAPAGAIVVSESGMLRAEDISVMRGWGVSAFLIGESLMRAEDPGAALAGLIAASRGEP